MYSDNDGTHLFVSILNIIYTLLKKNPVLKFQVIRTIVKTYKRNKSNIIIKSKIS